MEHIMGIIKKNNKVKLWDKNVEKQFFKEALNFASLDQLCYKTEDNQLLAFWPKGYKGKKSTLQTRNSLIGSYTEKWTRDLIQHSVKNLGLYAIQDAVCDEFDLSSKSPADVVISNLDDTNLSPENIKLIIEVKMSLTWNWELKKLNDTLKVNCLGSYKDHSGVPGLLRSDSMLKAIGKSINIRVSSFKSSSVPILIIGNTPISNSYMDKVDHLKNAGIIQGFWSINPQPLNEGEKFVHTTEKEGFKTFENFDEFKNNIQLLLNKDLNFFSSMKTKKELGKFIEISNKEKTYEKKAEILLKLLKE